MAPKDKAEAQSEPDGKVKPDVSYLESTIGYALRRAQVAVFQDIFRAFGDEAVSLVQFSVLAVVADNPGIGQAELAQTIGVERPRMVPVINELEKRGLAERKLSPDDGRARQIFLTAEGERLLAELKLRFARHQEGLIKKIGKRNAEKFLSILLKVADLG